MLYPDLGSESKIQTQFKTFLLQVQKYNLYQSSDVTLATFLANSSPNLQKKCSLQLCGDDPAAHMISYLHSQGLISFSMTNLPEGKELPGVAEGQIWFWARPTEVCICLRPILES